MDKEIAYLKYIKLGVLLCLCLQNCCHALFTRYSRSVLKDTWSEYEVVMIAELLKLITAGWFMMHDVSDTDSKGDGIHRLLWLLWNGKKYEFKSHFECFNVILV